MQESTADVAMEEEVAVPTEDPSDDPLLKVEQEVIKILKMTF